MAELGGAKRSAPLIVTLVLALAACSGGSSGSPASTAPAGTENVSIGDTTPNSSGPSSLPPAGTVPALEAGVARDALAAASFDDPATLAGVEEIKTDPVMVAAAVELVAAVPAGAPRWAAVLVLANATGTADVLVPLLTDPDPTIRVMAAIGAVGQGERAGFPVLIEALSHDEFMAGFQPPATVWATASLALARHTGLVLGPALDADAADREASIGRWQDWWGQHEQELSFDAATEEWSA